jgi:hemolysin D
VSAVSPGSLVARINGAYQRLAELDARRDEREFLPAALEVLETPASPTGRALGLTIILFFVIALAWAVFGKVDVAATATGRLKPPGDVKVIQPADTGVVRAIHVEDGEHVAAGKLLIELDPTQATADRDRLSDDLVHASLDVARLTALKAAAETGRAPSFVAPPGVAESLADEARAAMQAQFDQQAAKISDLTQQIDQKSAETAEVRAQIAEINASLPMLSGKEQIYQRLHDKGFATTLAYLDSQQQLSAAQHELAVQDQRAAQTADARAALVSQRDSARSAYAADVLADLRKAQEEQTAASQQLIQAQNRASRTELHSPISGVVEQLAVHSLQGVVTPAEHLMIVVPDSPNLMVEARLADQDVGFVHPGQTVKVKVETYNFTRYGFVDGRVVSVSRDVVQGAAQPAAGPPAGQVADGSAPPSYIARIALAKTSMMIDGRTQSLQPGMAVTAEIKTGERTILDFLVSPLARRGEESLHER